MNSFCVSRAIIRPFLLRFSANKWQRPFSRSRFSFTSSSAPNDENAKANAANEQQNQQQQSEQQTDVNLNEALNALKEENKSLLEKVEELNDSFKRALADGENSRVRLRREIDEAKIYGIQNFSKDLLDVADVLEKAITTVPQDAINSNQHLKTLVEGVNLTEKQLQNVFRRHGLIKINPIGCKFDPNEHHAMFEVDVESKEPGTVAEVIKIGYKLHDRTIRPALVGVVKRKQ
ncbi:grpE protein 1-like protein [Dinothrombium tinctorium]|uniref:GrpE protein homolog n=1 Tax=Dinothrombium tinctorium TaxID=1965070 RepID=A0A3S3PAC9_9ACAR|nr:grpE protein 1-like protein [Dinothrombium tinctorium]